MSELDALGIKCSLDDTNDQVIVRTIISMAKSLGLNVIAEGVESELQKQYLIKEGCLMFQGYYFSGPAPIDSFCVLSDNPDGAIQSPSQKNL